MAGDAQKLLHPPVGLLQRQRIGARLEGRSITDFIGADNVRRLRAGEAVQIDLERQPLRSVAHGGPVALAVPLRLGDELLGAMALAYEQEPHAYTEDELALAEAVGQ
ncbi:MAG: GAF domain-containing protein, partial [Ktedonobacterales bacterium]